MRKILFLTTQFPYPLDNGGKIGAFNGLSVISKNNKVVVVSFSEDSSGYLEGKKYFEKILPNVTFLEPVRQDVHIRKKPFKLASAIVRAMIKNVPYTYKVFFLGGLSWKANLDGLEWFVNDVFPIIKSNVPQASLTIIGGGLNYNPFEGKNGVEYLGYMKDISGVYEDKMVFIVPLFEGSGIRIKILEAFDNEVPVVSTSIGCGTIGAIDGEQLIVADDKDEFAKGVIKLLQDEKLNKEIRKNAKEFLQNKYSLTKRQEEFENEIQKLYRKKSINHIGEL